MRTFLKLLVLVPLAAIAAMFAVANRQVVTVSFDPFATDVPGFALSGPLFVIVILVLVAGVVLGGVASWLNQGRHRRRLRKLKRQNAALQADVDRLQADLATSVQPIQAAGRGANLNLPALPGRSAA